ncbi:MAG: dephospho-CoA kinase [Thermodesulfovibrionales bacterium]|nr:dephospho-CoA kinase [Thermodesulfovibrionales bacterium]
MKKILMVGLTGNYGAGKSYILEFFKQKGALTINSDELVRELLKKGEIKKEVRDLLGEGVCTPDGELDRKKIADIIFNDAFLRLKLENIIHPEVFREIERILSNIKEGIIIVEMPVLFERGYQYKFDRVITVYADDMTIFKRLEAKGISRDEILKRWNNQFGYDKKIRCSDFVIDNSEGRDIKGQIESVYSQLKEELQEGVNDGDQKT